MCGLRLHVSLPVIPIGGNQGIVDAGRHAYNLTAGFVTIEVCVVTPSQKTQCAPSYAFLRDSCPTRMSSFLASLCELIFALAPVVSNLELLSSSDASIRFRFVENNNGAAITRRRVFRDEAQIDLIAVTPQQSLYVCEILNVVLTVRSEYEDRTVEAGRLYSYQVASENSAGFGQLSAPQLFGCTFLHYWHWHR